jgi:hypothetical protein
MNDTTLKLISDLGKISTGKMKSRALSAMPIIVHYRAQVGHYDHRVQGTEELFSYSLLPLSAEEKEELLRSTAELWKPEQLALLTAGGRYDDQVLDVLSLTDSFCAIKTPEEARDWLDRCGRFSPLSDTVTWSEFQGWQHITRLIQERGPLVKAVETLGSENAVKIRKCKEEIEALLFIGGLNYSTFFGPDSCEQHRILGSWFGRPPAKMLRVEFLPRRITKQITNQLDLSDSILGLREGGLMWEFLLEPDKLRPVLVIACNYAIQAIAATLYAERISGAKFKRCAGDRCDIIFELKNNPLQIYHDTLCEDRTKKKKKRRDAKAARLRQERQNTKAAKLASPL